MEKTIRNIADESPSYFLCGKRHIPALIEKAKQEATQVLKEFAAFYSCAGTLDITIQPVQYACGYSIGATLTWNDEPIQSETDCSLLFLRLNELMLNRMIKAGLPSRGT